MGYLPVPQSHPNEKNRDIILTEKKKEYLLWEVEEKKKKNYEIPENFNSNTSLSACTLQSSLMAFGMPNYSCLKSQEHACLKIEHIQEGYKSPHSQSQENITNSLLICVWNLNLRD